MLVLDQAGWHLSDKLDIPDNITLMPLPPKSPELNPVENIWQFIRDNWLSNRVFRSYEDILDHCCFAWNKLVDQPWSIMSIGLRDCAHIFFFFFFKKKKNIRAGLFFGYWTRMGSRSSRLKAASCSGVVLA